MPKDDKMTDILTKALAAIDADTFRQLVAENIRVAVKEYDVQRLISGAVEATVREIVRAVIAEPETMATLQAKVRDAMVRASFEVTTRR